MKRTLLLLFTVLSLSPVQAQESYYGLGGTVLALFSEGTGYLLGLQLGGPIGAGLELRGTLDTVLIASNIGFDLLYPFALSAGTKGYIGGGAGFFYQLAFASVSAPRSLSGTFEFHGTVGLEYGSKTSGLYAEVQPYFLLGQSVCNQGSSGRQYLLLALRA